MIALVKIKNTTLYVGFFDLSKAFCRVSRLLTLKALVKKGVGYVMLNTLKYIYSTTRCILNGFGKLSEVFETHTNITEGVSSSVILFITFLDDISKAFDTINHELLIAKLYAYGLDRKSVLLIRNYLTNRWHRTKINSSFSSWQSLINGVPQGSVLGPLLFNIYLNDLFYFIEETEASNYADDTNIHACDMNLNNLLKRLEHDALIAVEWFESNYMKINRKKCHILITGKKYEHIWLNVGSTRIWESSTEKLLGVIIDSKLKFDIHVNSLIKIAGRKLTAMSRLSRVLSFSKLRMLIRSFFESQFAYCPLVWMFCSRSLNGNINKLRERAMRILYKDDITNFQDLLIKDRSETIHDRNIKLLAIEMYKAANNISPSAIADFLPNKVTYHDTRNKSNFTREKVNSVHYGAESLRILGPKLWGSSS